VESAALVDALPAGRPGGSHSATIVPEAQPAPPRAGGFYARSAAVSPGFFRTLGVSLQRGREFVDTDVAVSPPVVIVSAFTAGKFWPHQDPIGKRVLVGGRPLEIVGVATNTQTGWAGDPPVPVVYVPVEQAYSTSMSVLVRTNSNPAAALEPLRSAIHVVDPEVAVVDASTVADAVGKVLVPIRIAAIVLGSLGLIGFGIAVLGLYGVVAYVVSQRTREFGIRKALGANGSQIHVAVLIQGLRMLGLGVVPGLLVAVIGAGFLRHLLYGVEPHDPLTFIGVPLVLVLVGLAASVIPARRAARVDANVALREL
jgi:ABC-type antimicrobial peptide transport system permease subunit